MLMKIEVGKSYRVAKNRASFYGKCYDLIEVEGKIVNVTENAGNSEDYRIKDELGKIHVCQACNLEEVKVTKLTLRDEGTKCEYGTVGEESPFKDSDGAKLYVGDTVEKFYNGRSYSKDFVVKTNDYGFFVMGIQGDCNNSTGKIKGWTVKLVEKHDSLKAGDKCGCITVIEVEEPKQTEQQKDNIKEDGIVTKGLKVGDNVKVINWDSIYRVEVGDTAEIIGIREGRNQPFTIKMDKDQEKWYARESQIELIKETNPKFEIITSGTTTTVKFEDGRQGTAKLYYKDTFSKGFGIVAALGKAMDIALVEEVQRVAGSYGLTGKDLSSAKNIVNKTDVGRPTRNFKAGDRVKLTQEIVNTNGKTSMGDTAKIEAVNINDYKITMDKDGDFWWADDNDLEAVITVFKVGDSVKVREDLISEKSYFKGVTFREAMGKYKGKTFKITATDRYCYTLSDISWNWTYDMLELVEDKAENEVTVTVADPGFKKGDKIYREMEGYDTLVGVFVKAEGYKVWANWNSDFLKELPKTILEFNKVELNTISTYVTTKKSVKKLVLVDDTEPEIKVGDMVTKEQAIKILKTGGKIKSCSFTYFEEYGILKYKREDGTSKVSAGYDVNLGGKLEVISLSKDIDKSQAEKMVKEGKEITVNNIFKYFLEDGVLMFRNIKTGMLHESLGFKDAFKEGFTYSIA
jgi:hypothetical protein